MKKKTQQWFQNLKHQLFQSAFSGIIFILTVVGLGALFIYAANWQGFTYIDDDQELTHNEWMEAVQHLFWKSSSAGVIKYTGSIEIGGTVALGGELQIGSKGTACGSTTAGMLRYANNSLSYCNGSSWVETNYTETNHTETNHTPSTSSRYPGCNVDDITLNGYTIAACNVGATQAGIGKSSYGNYYTWGINTPGLKEGNSNDNARSVGRGPCAEGYHVPSYEEWGGLLQAHLLNKGIIFSGSSYSSAEIAAAFMNDFKLPRAGFLNNYYSPSFTTGQDARGRYRSSSKYGNNAYSLYFDQSYILTENENSRESGLSVRCFKDSTNNGGGVETPQNPQNPQTSQTRTTSCTDLPANASWNTVSSITQTLNGSTWTPSAKGSYNESSSTTACRFKCDSGYSWDGISCSRKEDGQCGTASGKYISSAPTDNGHDCVGDHPTNYHYPETSDGWTWTCPGKNGGKPAQCEAYKHIDGKCGSAAQEGQCSPFALNSAIHLCSKGTPSSVTSYNGRSSWICRGTNGDSNKDAHCSCNN